MTEPFRVLSWGCGVQSTTLGEMSAQGHLPKLDAVITADTGWERARTYAARDHYAARWEAAGIPVHIIQHGNVRIQGAEEHKHIPFWTETGGPLRRQCTRDFKIRPIRRKIRELLGFHPSKPPAPPPGAVELWIGISLDEWTRAKHSRQQFIVKRWPLLEQRLDRLNCAEWLTNHDLPVPVQSACIGCPYRAASQWLAMQRDDPEEFADACDFDQANRHNPLAEGGGSTAAQLYIFKHGPLATVDLQKYADRERITQPGIQLPMAICDSGYCWT